MIKLMYHMNDEIKNFGNFYSREEAGEQILKSLKLWNNDLYSEKDVNLIKFINDNDWQNANKEWRKVSGEYWTFE